MPVTLHEHALFGGSQIWGGLHHLHEDVDPHAHDFLELAVVGPGSGRHTTSQGDQALQHGDVVVLRPGAWHGFKDCTGLTVANCCVSAQALSTDLAPLYEIPILRRLLWTDPIGSGAHGIVVVPVDPTAADEAIEAIGALESEARPGRQLGRLVTVLGILADQRDDEPTTADRSIHPAVTSTVARLEASPAHPWRLDDLAQEVNLDPAYLGRLFRQYVGLSPMAFLARVRAERAATLLAHSTMPAARVGAAVGWADPTYFARRFRALVGLTPTEYRDRLRMDAGPYPQASAQVQRQKRTRP